MRLTTTLAPLAAGLLAIGSAQGAVSADGAVFTLMLSADDVSITAAGGATMTQDGAVFLPFGQADGLAASQGIEGSYMGSGVTFSSGGVDVALTDFVIGQDGEMTGMITATGVDGVSGMVMHGRMTLFDLAQTGDAFDLRLDGMAGGVLSDLLGKDLRGEVVAQLSAAPSPTPLPGALLFFATGAGAFVLRRRRA